MPFLFLLSHRKYYQFLHFSEISPKHVFNAKSGFTIKQFMCFYEEDYGRDTFHLLISIGSKQVILSTYCHKATN